MPRRSIGTDRQGKGHSFFPYGFRSFVEKNVPCQSWQICCR